jgi:hypothetical protein
LKKACSQLDIPLEKEDQLEEYLNKLTNIYQLASSLAQGVIISF